MVNQTPSATQNVDILGNTWTARHLARALLAEGPTNLKVRMWNEGLTPLMASPLADTKPKLMLVPEFLKDHKGLGFRTNLEQVYIHHRRRRRDLWLSPQVTAAQLGCCPEVLALLYDLIYFNSYGAELLAGQRLKILNYDWQRAYDTPNPSRYTPSVTVLAAKPSIERVWDNTLIHDGAELHFHSTLRVESVRAPSTLASLALIMSPPNGLQDDTTHVVLTSTNLSPTNEDHSHTWIWKSYQCVVNRELAASIPGFFVWIDEIRGQDFLETGLLYDGAILRGICVPLPQSDDKILIQIDRLSRISNKATINPQDFFCGSPWYSLSEQIWEPMPPSLPDDLIYNKASSPNEVVKKILRAPISVLGASPTGLEHHSIANASSSKTVPRIVSR